MSQLINVISPQATILVGIIMDKLLNLGKLFKTLFYTEEEVKEFFLGPEFDIALRLG